MDKWTIDEMPWMIGTITASGKRISAPFIVSKNDRTVAWWSSYRRARIYVAEKGGEVDYRDCTFVY